MPVDIYACSIIRTSTVEDGCVLFLLSFFFDKLERVQETL